MCLQPGKVLCVRTKSFSSYFFVSIGSWDDFVDKGHLRSFDD